MADLPITKVVKVEITKETRYPTAADFNTMIIFTSVAVAGVLDAATPTRTYSGMGDVATDYPTTSAMYKAMQVAFSQNPTATTVKAGYIDAADIAGGLDTVRAYDSGWFLAGFTDEFRDDAAATTAIADWFEAAKLMCALDTNDIKTKTLNLTGHTAGILQSGMYDHTCCFYSDDVTDYASIAHLSHWCTVNYDFADSAETAKFKRLYATSAVSLTSGQHRTVTGFVEGKGQDATQGYFANAQVMIAGLPMVSEGTMGSGEFWDVTHSLLWTEARIQEEVFGTLYNAKKIKYTDTGFQQIATAVKTVLDRAFTAGIIADDVNADGDAVSAYTINAPRVSSISAALRANRIAPAPQFCFRLAGAIHYVMVDGCVRV